jgi:hypothetical protein
MSHNSKTPTSRVEDYLTGDVPTLVSLAVQGVVKWEESSSAWLGRASDGVWVHLGHDAASAERYLSAHPTPDQW